MVNIPIERVPSSKVFEKMLSLKSLNQEQVATALNTSVKNVSDMISGKRDINADMALKIAYAFDQRASDYYDGDPADLDQARENFGRKRGRLKPIWRK